MRKPYLTWLKSAYISIRKIFKNPSGTKDITGEKHKDICGKKNYIIDTNGLNYIKEKCAKNELYVSPILLECMKQGYKFDIKLKAEIMEIFQKEAVIPIIRI